MQWGQDPAGALAVADAPLGTPESFAQIEAHRLREQPWMRETFKFDRYEGRRVLEIGVGLGTDHLQFARAGAKMTGIDLTPSCVALTWQRVLQEGLRSDLRVMDAETLEFPDHSFDAVYSFGVLHHVPSMDRALREVRRVLRPGGRFVGGLYSRNSFFWTRWLLRKQLSPELRRMPMDEYRAQIEHSESGAIPYVRLLSRRELARLLWGAGFADVSIVSRHAGLGRFTERVPARIERTLGRVGGWYLIHDAT